MDDEEFWAEVVMRSFLVLGSILILMGLGYAAVDMWKVNPGMTAFVLVLFVISFLVGLVSTWQKWRQR